MSAFLKQSLGALVAAVAVVIAVLSVQFAMVAADINKIEAISRADFRAGHERLEWVFDEWDRCSRGEGSYPAQGYLTKRQCDAAVTQLARDRGMQDTVSRVLVSQARQTELASSQIDAPWPLSLVMD